MQDLTGYSDDELSLVVFNTEHLYEIRHSSSLGSILGEDYLYTGTQLESLKRDLEEDEES